MPKLAGEEHLKGNWQGAVSRGKGKQAKIKDRRVLSAVQRAQILYSLCRSSFQSLESEVKISTNYGHAPSQHRHEITYIGTLKEVRKSFAPDPEGIQGIYARQRGPGGIFLPVSEATFTDLR